MNSPVTIFIVGMPASGKTTLGKQLAQKMGYAFQDLDQVIEKELKTTIRTIFTENGEAYFRQLEADTLRKMKWYRTVLAVGGGTPCFHDNMTWMNKHGTTLFLNTPLETITERLQSASHRPLMTGNVTEKVHELWEKRQTDYRNAHITVSSPNLDEIIAMIQ